jgi:hypothetical protein
VSIDDIENRYNVLGVGMTMALRGVFVWGWAPAFAGVTMKGRGGDGGGVPEKDKQIKTVSISRSAPCSEE